MPAARSLGAEEEIQVVDPDTWQLVPSAPQLLSRLPGDQFGGELQRSTVETNTAVCPTLGELRSELVRLRGLLAAVAEDAGLAVAAVGMAPQASTDDFELAGGGRFSRMQQDYRVLVDQHLICGLQIHVGVDDRDLAVRLMPRLGPTLPTLLALSASSPFWRGKDTGYASMRTMVWQRWPTAGSPEALGSWAEYDDLVQSLIRSGVISDAKMAYFDVRPSYHAPTLELRVCDSCPLVDDAVLIAALFRAAVDRAAYEEAAGVPPSTRPGLLQRAAIWRAARSGLSGALLDETSTPEAQPAPEVVRALVSDLRPYLEETGDWDEVVDLSGAILARGSSADRQRARFGERGKITDVVEQVVTETSGRATPRAWRPRSIAGYPEASADEAVTIGGLPVSTYRPVFRAIDRLGPAGLAARAVRGRESAARNGLTFGVAGNQQPFWIDLVPRIIQAHEWATLSVGLTQRARAIELFLRDIYGAAQIVADGVLPAAVVAAGPGYRPEARTLPADVVRAAVTGFDLVRDSVAGWRVLEDNARVPSGVGYAVGVRHLLAEVAPELLATTPVRDPQGALDLLGRTLRGCAARDDPEVALLSDGADNSAWYEHRLIAEGAGLILAQAGEVEFAGRAVIVGDRRVDVIYLRLEIELSQLSDVAGRPVGARLLAAAQRGDIVLVNAPGNGIADDKAMFCFVADFIGYYLNERPLLPPVPTYRCADDNERTAVLDRVGELVTKPVDGYGGHGVLIGPSATAEEIEQRRRDIQRQPERWVAQETVDLSTLPTLAEDRLEPRHVDLRAFVYLTGTGPGEAHLGDLALTRVAPAGSMIVNSSQGGGAKDTWIADERAGA